MTFIRIHTSSFSLIHMRDTSAFIRVTLSRIHVCVTTCKCVTWLLWQYIKIHLTHVWMRNFVTRIPFFFIKIHDNTYNIVIWLYIQHQTMCVTWPMWRDMAHVTWSRATYTWRNIRVMWFMCQYIHVMWFMCQYVQVYCTQRRNLHTHTRTHTHAHTHTRTHIYIHKYTYTHIGYTWRDLSDKHIHTLTNIHTHLLSNINIHTRISCVTWHT